MAMKKQGKPMQFIVIPGAIKTDTVDPGFVSRSLYYWLTAVSPIKWSPPIPRFSSLTRFLRHRKSHQSKHHMITFNNKPNENMNRLPFANHSAFDADSDPSSSSDENERDLFFARRSMGRVVNTTHKKHTYKFEESLSMTSKRWSSTSTKSVVTKFPALIAQIREDGFDAHEKLKACMNAFQSKEQSDIYIRRMTEKKNINKTWTVQGLIDPDKHLSTLDHSLNLDALESSTSTVPFSAIMAANNNSIINYHHWIPAVFQVNEQATECKLLSEIANLNAYKYGNTLYNLLEQLFLFQLPQFENVIGHNLRNTPLQVVVKAQDYQLSDCSKEDSYLGNMHREGLYEDIAAVGLYYYHIDKDIKGGELELSSVIQAEDTHERDGVTVLRETSVAVKEGSSVVFKRRSGVTVLRETSVAVNEGSSVVFNNKLCYHRVSKLYGNGSRKIIAFFLLSPSRWYSAIDARFVVVNWKYHAEHLLFQWLKEEGLMNGYEWILDILCEYVVGDRKYIEDATEFYNECRRAYSGELTFDASSITSRGRSKRDELFPRMYTLVD
eukprot:CAMPEP_0197077110 /NCGR_PEP_ID=MMETSP1384-20130603/212451_1 /TAXON_ID=29189 /ORGANISM="Ammonia sp." /LENGTH=552 /DNA_ID=CAMNT_0042515969 /DNA_START=194 /DNA_END=1853 /DNA_ORIENTATION=-